MKKTIAIAMLVGASARCWGIDVATTAGNLKDAVASPASVTALTVTGTIDAADFMFILDSMPALESLDLSGAVIAEYAGDRLLNSVAQSPAGMIPPAAFLGSRLSSFAFPANTTGIGDGAFAATRLTAVSVPAGVTTIGASAFAENPALTSATIPAGVTAQGTGVFQGCTALASVTIGGSPAEIPALTFSGCTALEGVKIPASVRVVGDRAFAGSGLRSVTLSDVDSVGAWAFASCPSLAEVTFSGSAPTSVGQGAFFRDSNAAVRGASPLLSVQTLPAHAFTGVKEVEGLGQVAASPLTEVGEYALACISPGENVYLPGSLESVATGAFANWHGVKSIDATDLRELPALGDEVFGSLDKPSTTLYVAPDMVAAFQSAPQWKEFNILARTSGETGIAAPATPADATLTARFEGALLRLEASCPITAAELYDLGGRVVASRPGQASEVLTIDTAPLGERVFIARVFLGGDTVKILKLAR